MRLNRLTNAANFGTAKIVAVRFPAKIFCCYRQESFSEAEPLSIKGKYGIFFLIDMISKAFDPKRF
jgi:hypothetical protein